MHKLFFFIMIKQWDIIERNKSFRIRWSGPGPVAKFKIEFVCFFVMIIIFLLIHNYILITNSIQ